MKNRKIKYGSMSVTVTVLFIAGVILFNIVFGLLTDRFYLKADLTETKVYQITEDTKKILADLPQEMKFTVLSKESDLMVAPYNIAHELLAKYEQLSGGKLKVEYLDPKLNPSLEKTFAAITLRDKDIVVSSPMRYVNVNIDELYAWSETDEGYVASGVKAEQALTGSILYAASEIVPEAVYTVGHNETTSMEAFNSALKTAHFSVTQVNLQQEDFPEEATLVVICAPNADFTQVELDKLDAFLSEGRNCIYLPYPGATTLNNLELYLAEWGIEPQKATVAEPEDYIAQRWQVLLGLEDNQMTETLLNFASRPIAMQIAPIKRLFTEKAERKTESVLVTTSKAYAKPWTDNEISAWEKESGDLSGPFDIGVLSTNTVYDDQGMAEYSHIFTIGVSFIMDEYMNTSSYLNGRFISRMLDLYNPRTTSLYIDPIATSLEPLTLTGGQGNVVFWVLVILIPVALWAFGFVVWFRRRNL